MKREGTAALLLAAMPKKGAAKSGKEEPVDDDESSEGAYDAIAADMMAAFASKDTKALAAALRDWKEC